MLQPYDEHPTTQQKRGVSPWLMYWWSRLCSVHCTWPSCPPVVGFWPAKPCTNPYPHPWNTLTHGKGMGLHRVRVKVGVKTPMGYPCPSLDISGSTMPVYMGKSGFVDALLVYPGQIPLSSSSEEDIRGRKASSTHSARLLSSWCHSVIHQSFLAVHGRLLSSIVWKGRCVGSSQTEGSLHNFLECDDAPRCHCPPYLGT